jgi:hypothetical protein
MTIDVRITIAATIAGIEHTGGATVTLTPTAPTPSPPPVPSPLPPPPVPAPTPGAWPTVGIKLAGALAPPQGSLPVGARSAVTTLSRPAPGVRVADPRFPGVLVRGLGPGWVPEYSQISADSPDGRRLLLVKPDNGHMVFDRATLAQVRAIPPDRYAPRWLPDGRVLLLAGNPYRFLAWDPDSNATTPLYTSSYPYGLTAHVHEEPSEDGRWTAGMGHSGGAPTVIAVNLRENRLGMKMTVPSDAVNWARATPDGKLIAVQWNAAGSGRNRGIELFDIESGAFVRQLAPEGHHGDWGRAPDGRVFYVTHSMLHPSNNNYPSIVAYWTDGAAPTHLRMVEWGVLGHVSCRGPRGWICVTNQRAGAEVPNAPGELWLMHVVTGETLRLAHHRSSGGTYWAEPHATLARDGKSVFFGSDWNGGAVGSFALEL